MRESTESSRRCNKSCQIKMQQESSDASRVVKSNDSSRRVASPPATPSVWISLLFGEISSDDPSTPPQDRMQSIKPTLAFETGDPSQNFGQSRQMRQESSNRMQLESSNQWVIKKMLQELSSPSTAFERQEHPLPVFGFAFGLTDRASATFGTGTPRAQ